VPSRGRAFLLCPKFSRALAAPLVLPWPDNLPVTRRRTKDRVMSSWTFVQLPPSEENTAIALETIQPID